MEDILEAINTVEERDRLYSEIELVSEALYREGELGSVLSSKISKTLHDYLGSPPASQARALRAGETSHDILSQKLSGLKKNLAGFAVLKLTLAFEPSESTIERIITFIRQNLGDKTILDIGVEPLILGGVIFEFKGLYKDYTLKTKLEEVFKNKKEELWI